MKQLYEMYYYITNSIVGENNFNVIKIHYDLAFEFNMFLQLPCNYSDERIEKYTR